VTLLIEPDPYKGWPLYAVIVQECR
jgi:hypothetical protein